MHIYAEGIKFYFHPKEKFDKILDHCKVLDIEEYKTEERDGFESLYRYWNDRSVRDVNRHIEHLERRIELKK